MQFILMSETFHVRHMTDCSVDFRTQASNLAQSRYVAWKATISRKNFSSRFRGNFAKRKNESGAFRFCCFCTILIVKIQAQDGL